MATAPMPTPDTAEALDPLAAPDEAEGTAFERLSDEAKQALLDMLTSALKADQSGRRAEVRDAWKLRDYAKGRQHNFYDKRSYIYLAPEASGMELPAHMGTFDITSPHKRSICSILTENPPGINFVPNDLQQGNDVTAAKMAEKMRGRVDRLLNFKKVQQKMAGYLCTDCRFVLWTHADANSKPRIDVYGTLESKVPLYIEDMADWDFCVLSREVSEWKAKDENPDFADKISSSSNATAETSYERYARLAIVSTSRGGNADSLKGLVTEHNGWIAPCRYLKIGDKDDTTRAEISAAFPSGVRIHAFGDVVVDAVDEDMSALDVEHPVDGEGQVRPALLSGVPDIQDAYNDCKNLRLEALDKGTGLRVYNREAIDEEGYAEQTAEPGGAIFLNIPAGRPIGEFFDQEPNAEVSQGANAMSEELKQDAEFVTSDFPVNYGGDTPGQDTVGVNKLLNSNAKGQLGPAWSAIQRGAAAAYPVAIRLVAAIEQGPVAVDGNDGQSSVDPHVILDGNFLCHPDQDSAFPETTADKRASLQAVLGQLGTGPQGEAIVYQPDNLALIKQFSGLHDLVIPGAEARDKQLREIDQMLNEPPIPPSDQEMQQWQQASAQAQQQGQPAPPQPQPQPSVSVDPVWDVHQPEIDKITEWLSSDACAEAMRAGKFAGIQNIKLHGMAHKTALQGQQSAPPIPPPKVSISIQTADPTATANALHAAGLTDATPQTVAQSQMGDQQEQSAKTNELTATANHKQVLAATEEAKTPHEIAALNRPQLVQAQPNPNDGAK